MIDLCQNTTELTDSINSRLQSVFDSSNLRCDVEGKKAVCIKYTAGEKLSWKIEIEKRDSVYASDYDFSVFKKNYAEDSLKTSELNRAIEFVFGEIAKVLLNEHKELRVIDI